MGITARGSAADKTQELAALMAEPLEGITVIPDDTNLLQWKVLMQGPVCSTLFIYAYMATNAT